MLDTFHIHNILLFVTAPHSEARRKMNRGVIQFGAGPSQLPREVLLKAQEEMLHYGHTGISVTELSHWTREFKEITVEAERLLRDLMVIPDNYTVLFLAGGGNGQFAAIPMNLIGLKPGRAADYVITGRHSSRAAREAEKYGTINQVIPKTSDISANIPDQSTWQLDPDASYVYYCDNETIEGIEFNYIPDAKGVPLVCDMTSNILSRRVDVCKFGLIFAAAQKNLGLTGVTVVIVRDDLIGHSLPICPNIFNYCMQKKAESLYNTPPTFSIYMMGLVLKWLEKEGGTDAMEIRSKKKARIVYEEIDSSRGFYHSAVDESGRSRMNVCFRIGSCHGDTDLEQKFVEEAWVDWEMCSLACHK